MAPAAERMRPVGLGRLDAVVEQRGDGAILVRSTVPLADVSETLTDRLRHWAMETPDRIFLAERDARGGWHSITYGETLQRVERIAAALLARGLSPERPVMILSGNSIRHGLLALGAMHAGIPYAPLSTAYSLVSTDFGKLRLITAKLSPGLVFAEDYSAFARAIQAAVEPGVEVVCGDDRPVAGVTPFEVLESWEMRASLEAAHRSLCPDTVAKVLFTSGSTGQPKGVLTTQRMLCANQMMLKAWMPFLADEPPVLLDWLPWNHTFGSNHNFGLVLWNGGTLYIDDGRPAADGIEATVRNLKEVSPTLYFNVPKGFEALLPHLGRDATLRASYLRRLRLNFYSGASLGAHVWAGLDRIALRETGERICMLTGYGSTETAPAAVVPTEAMSGPGVIGLPLPGITVKLVDADGKLEARLAGPTITPGYWREPELTAAAFDEDGYYRIGDALRFVDRSKFERGLAFDGRLAEDFKLSTGTWVRAGALRLAVLEALAPLARDAVVSGHDRDFVGLLIFPDIENCRRLAPDLSDTELIASETLRQAFAVRLVRLACSATGSSTRITRAVLLAEPPSIDDGEVTDKGSLNQRAVLTRRARSVADLYADPPPAHVIIAV